MTKAEIMAMLDERGIAYPKKATVAQLSALLPELRAVEEPAKGPEAAPEEPEEAQEGTVRVRVASAFLDRHTRELHREGDVLDVTRERLAEVLAVGPFLDEL